VNPLLGPGPNEPMTFHKYTFVLYRQQSNLTLAVDERAKIVTRLNFNVSVFAAAHNLTGAAGINWGFSMVDPWALVQLDLLGFRPLDCFGAVQQTANSLGIVPKIIPALDLLTQLRVSFNQPADTFMNCESAYKYPGVNMSLSDTNVALVYQTPWDLRSYRPGPNKTKAMTSYVPSITWSKVVEGNLYTLLVVDPIYVLDPASALGPFFTHHMVVTINNTDISTGEVILPYFGPAPLDPLYHKYLFLLYRQPSLLKLTSLELNLILLRKNFNLTTFVTAHTLGNPVGANWAFAMADFWAPVAQSNFGYKPLVCPAAPTPAGQSNYVHLSPGAFTAIAVIGGIIILVLLVLVLRANRKVGHSTSGYNVLPGGDGGRKTSVNREK